MFYLSRGLFYANSIVFWWFSWMFDLFTPPEMKNVRKGPIWTINRNQWITCHNLDLTCGGCSNIFQCNPLLLCHGRGIGGTSFCCCDSALRAAWPSAVELRLTTKSQCSCDQFFPKIIIIIGFVVGNLQETHRNPMIFNTFTIFYLQMWEGPLPPTHSEIPFDETMKRPRPGEPPPQFTRIASAMQGGFPLEKGERKAVFNPLSSKVFLQISIDFPQ